MEIRNVFEGNREIEILSPRIGLRKYQITEIFDKNGKKIDSARHAGEIISFKIDIEVKQFDLIR